VLQVNHFSRQHNCKVFCFLYKGGNTGLGKETGVKLASLGAETLILCRTPSRAESAVAEIKQRSGSNAVRALSLDLADLKSIEKCTNELKSSVGKIDILVNNAGVMAIPTRCGYVRNYRSLLQWSID
jgi:NAD(P)-dependent dehydrogenase (short-subunit alcohol dehydrogenase family)